MQKLLKECEKAYNEKNYSRLEWLCNKILEQDKNNEIALTYKAYCNWHHYNIIFRITEKIHKLYPSNFHAYNAEALAYLNKNEFEKALDCCEIGLKINDYNGLKINKIEALISLNRLDEAYEFYMSSEIQDYNFTKALINCGKYSELYKYEDELSKEELVDYFLKRCEYLYRKGWSGNEILKVCDEIFKLDNDNEIALGYKITTLQYIDEDDKALKCADHAINVYPENYRFYFYKGETLMWAFDDIDGAIEYYEKGFSLVEDFDKHWPSVDNIVTALYRKADRLIKSDNYEDAIDINDKILFYKPKEFKALENIESIVSKYNINYEYSQHFNESFKLREESRKRVKKIEDCLGAIEIGEYDEEYIKGCSEFKDYNSIDEYIRDLIIYLMEAYPSHTEEHARFLVKCNMDYIKSSYEYKEPVAYCSIEVGYCCG